MSSLRLLLLDHEAYRKMIQALRADFIGEVGLDKRCLETVDWKTQESRAMCAIELALRIPSAASLALSARHTAQP